MALVARAFGAKGVIIEGGDDRLLRNIAEVLRRWGGTSYFSVRSVRDGSTVVREWKAKGGSIVHLTMYGINLADLGQEIECFKDPMLIIVGGAKVPGLYYREADYNIAVGNQPHSEVAALSIFLDRIYKGEELKLEFQDSELRVIPQLRGKKVVKVE